MGLDYERLEREALGLDAEVDADPALALRELERHWNALNANPIHRAGISSLASTAEMLKNDLPRNGDDAMRIVGQRTACESAIMIFAREYYTRREALERAVHANILRGETDGNGKARAAKGTDSGPENGQDY